MNVLCINNGGWAKKISLFFGLGTGWVQSEGPKFGDVDEVMGEIENEGKMFYELKAWPGGKYDAHYFIPISDLDETDMVKERLKEPVAWPMDKHFKIKDYV